jgi:hypothetical protein
VEALMQNVTIQNNAFVFCRYSVTVLVWLALLFQSVWLLGAVFVILLLSAVLGAKNAPMVWLYTQTVGRFVESKDVILDVRGMRFAHSAGAVLAAIALSLALRQAPATWFFVAAFAVIKTTSALGFCPAYKLYGCVVKDGGCCALTAKR